MGRRFIVTKMSLLSYARIRLILSYMIGLFFAFIVSIRILWYIVCSHKKVFYRKSRTQPPSCLNDESLGTHSYVHLENVRLHYVSNGAEDKQLMLLLHGFPEFWYSWRHQLREFAKDYRVVAVDQRGYSDSDKPRGIKHYKIENMVNDVKQLILALGYSSCVLAGHDWGGAISWAFAAKHPQMVDKLVIMNCPHPAVFQSYMRSHLAQFKKSWYMFMFLAPWVPEFYFRMADYKMLAAAFCSSRMGVVDKSRMSSEDIEAYKYAFSRPGCDTGSINYIRAMFRNTFSSKDMQKITSPTLLIWGCKDGALERGMAPLSEPLVQDLKIEYIEESSHWVQMDQPERVNQVMREFLNSTL